MTDSELARELAEKCGIYIASRTRHAARWRKLRAEGLPVVCTWIDESEVGQTKSFPDLWRRCVSESANAKALIAYSDGDDLLGGLIEIGAALASGTPVFIVGPGRGLDKAANHPLATRCDTIEQAIEKYRRLSAE